jgi:3-oxoacyl-[acyl-carrier-protein] synthase-3
MEQTDHMTYAHIIGTGAWVPDRVLSNADLEKIVDTSDEWITRRTGIKERRIARKSANEGTTAMGLRAAHAALEMAGVTPDQLDTIIVATVTADHLFPSAACMIQKELAAGNTAAYDLSAGCSGFIYALENAPQRDSGRPIQNRPRHRRRAALLSGRLERPQHLCPAG